MNNRPVPELQTDPEFDELIQPREEKYLKNSKKTSLTTDAWSLYVYGTVSYLRVVCVIRSVRNGISTSGAPCLKSRDKAISFICHEQLKRTDLTGEYKKIPDNGAYRFSFH